MKLLANTAEVYQFSKEKKVLHFLAEEGYSVLLFADHTSIYFGVGQNDQIFYYCYDTFEELVKLAVILSDSFDKMFRKSNTQTAGFSQTPGSE